MLLGQVVFVFGLQVLPEVHVIVELVLNRTQYIHRLTVGEPYKIRCGNVLQCRHQILIDKSGKEVEVVTAFVHYIGDQIFHHLLAEGHIAFEIAERHLRFHHPEFGGMPAGVGVFGPEGGPEGIDIAQCKCK